MVSYTNEVAKLVLFHFRSSLSFPTNLIFSFYFSLQKQPHQILLSCLGIRDKQTLSLLGARLSLLCYSKSKGKWWELQLWKEDNEPQWSKPHSFSFLLQYKLEKSSSRTQKLASKSDKLVLLVCFWPLPNHSCECKKNFSKMFNNKKTLPKPTCQATCKRKISRIKSNFSASTHM